MNTVLKYITIAAACICATIVFRSAAKSGRFFKSITTSAFFGILSLGAVALVSLFGVKTLPINAYTAGCSAICGVPGTILMLLTAAVWHL